MEIIGNVQFDDTWYVVLTGIFYFTKKLVD